MVRALRNGFGGGWSVLLERLFFTSSFWLCGEGPECVSLTFYRFKGLAMPVDW